MKEAGKDRNIPFEIKKLTSLQLFIIHYLIVGNIL